MCALLAGGGYAQYVALDARQAMAVPAGLSMEEAAALPETVLTVFSNVFEKGRLKAGETLLIHGATSGIGVTALQMGKAAGAFVITTGRNAEKAAAARSLGADVAINSGAADWVAAVAGVGGADVVLDMVGGSYLAGNLSVLKPDGRLAVIAFLGGHTAELDFAAILSKRLDDRGLDSAIAGCRREGANSVARREDRVAMVGRGGSSAPWWIACFLSRKPPQRTPTWRVGQPWGRSFFASAERHRR